MIKLGYLGNKIVATVGTLMIPVELDKEGFYLSARTWDALPRVIAYLVSEKINNNLN